MDSSSRSLTPARPGVETLSGLSPSQSKPSETTPTPPQPPPAEVDAVERERIIDSLMYEASLDEEPDLKPMAVQLPASVEGAFTDATRDVLYAMRDTVTHLTLVRAYLSNAHIAHRLRASCLDVSELDAKLLRLQRKLDAEADNYARIVFGVPVDLLPQ